MSTLTPTWSVYDDEEDDVAPESEEDLGCTRSLKSYVKRGVLQRGAQGAVYLAFDPETNREVAIKRYFTNFKQLYTRGVAETTMRELGLLQQMSHPNILKIDNVVSGPENDICAAMEYCPMSLSALVIQRKEQLSLPLMKYILHSLLSALQHLKERQIVHRDIKPSNVLISADGMVRLGDFGSARLHQKGTRLTPATQRITVVYRPPECLLGDPSYSFPVDMWGLGVVFAEMIERKYLFKGHGEIAVIGAVWDLIGTPSPEQWPEMKQLPACQSFSFAPLPSKLTARFGSRLSLAGLELLRSMLDPNPNTRISVSEALNHTFFKESPLMATAHDLHSLVQTLTSGPSPQGQQAAGVSARKAVAAQLVLGLGDDEDDDDDY